MTNKNYYKLKTSYATYYAEIWHQYPNIDKVFIGGKKRCLVFSIYLDFVDDPPNIDSFGYDEECNKKGNHLRGIGSVHLLKAGMKFIIDHYKLTSSKFILKDSSYIQCSNGRLSLPAYYTVFYGKTWYEDKFGAQPLFIPQETLKSQRQSLKQFIEMPTKPATITDFIDCDIVNPRIEKLLKHEYSKSKTLKDFFRTLKEEYDCSVFKSWLPILVTRFIPDLQDTEWRITYKDGPNIEVTRLDYKPTNMIGGSDVYVAGDVS